ncbi:Methyltransferase domain [Teratosphaeria destructans]|uniref:Methyltransferase domain n=1 Tax=Teratosphaeria destructans TaxID=418781 RepID=A0A9W7W0G6_9PEZI|nr:Methyltransferase domain [Teratosphaeria destructans]
MDGLFYAYHAPRSSAQRQYTQARLTAIAEERAKRKGSVPTILPSQKSRYLSVEDLERAASGESERSANATAASSLLTPKGSRSLRYQGSQDYIKDLPLTPAFGVTMESTTKANTSTSSVSSAHSDKAHRQLLDNPFELRHGRRYVREIPYPLPCDLAEIQRQNLRTMLGCKVFGQAICSPYVTKEIPRKVLDMGCGSGYWSAMCHEYFCSLGVNDVEFTGLDVAPVAPDLGKQGVNWRFMRHDFRRTPLPFEDGEFDLIICKDLSLGLPIGPQPQQLTDEAIRILREGGTVEIWDSDHCVRSLVAHPPPLPPKQRNEFDLETAKATATYPISPGTPFAPAQNKYLVHANNWIIEALDRRKLPPVPTTTIAQTLYNEAESLGDIGFRRIAIPLSAELRWEREKHAQTVGGAENSADSPLSTKGKSKQLGDHPLNEDQMALRQTALLTVLQMIESMEPMLKESSGKNAEEWSHWWASMMADLLDPSRGSLSGECLEVGAWWARKRTVRNA